MKKPTPSIPMSRRLVCFQPAFVDRVEAVIGERPITWKQWIRYNVTALLEMAELTGEPFPIARKKGS